MRVLIFGPHGQIGSALRQNIPEGVYLCASATNICDTKAVLSDIENFNPSVIINAAAYTNVELAEVEKEKAFAVNAVAPAQLSVIAKQRNILFVHYSTDYVFDGTGYGAWTEEDTPHPINTYGASKLEGDNQIIMTGGDYLIIRTSWVYSRNGKNFIKAILEKNDDKIHVVNDQIGTPNSVEFIARTTYDMIIKTMEDKDLCGVYNVSTSGETSWYELAKYICPDKNIFPISTKEYNANANRPLNSRLDTKKLKNTFGIYLPHWKGEVDKFLQQIIVIKK